MRLIKKTFILVAIVLPILAMKPMVPELPLDDEYVQFHVKNAGITVDGTFTDFDLNIVYDPANIAASSFSGTIDVKSIDTGIDMRDEHLVGEEYFDASNHPKIVFKSTSIAKLTDGRLKVVGNLTIKATTKVVELIVTPTILNGIQFFSTKLELDRMDYEVGESSWVLSDDVTCELKVAM